VTLYVLFDLADHRRGDILRHAVPLDIVARYYFSYIPTILVQMSPVALLLSTLYVLGLLAKNNELTAMLAAGISLRRATVGPVCVAAALTVGIFALSEWVMPGAFRHAREIEWTYFKSRSLDDAQRLVWIEPERSAMVSVKRYSPQEHAGYDVLITEWPRSGTSMRVEADRMVWDSRSATWFLEDGERTVYDPDSTRSERFDREPSFIRFEPAQIEALNVPAEELSARRLRTMLIELGRRGMVSPTRWVDFHQKLALPALNFIMVFLAIPFAARTARGGLAASLAISVTLGLVYVSSFGLCVGLARTQLVPGWLGVWFANVVFLAGGLWTYARMPT